MDNKIIDSRDSSGNKEVIGEATKKGLKFHDDNESESPPRDIQDSTETKPTSDQAAVGRS
eukprot:CAMPEP_0172488930 /NCGR_PEP_ID=MMETSP1066-20121228/18654_1 /TAXON_ID=671091 /ORGANISM="Coscinodiscus wailesii, Strain CCMP2513" /LENGTH=59 /DNA_ID=CAMNT_0013256451 /DNA_START=66 /DNA_END=242 /DNA_ORIENTATION=+